MKGYTKSCHGYNEEFEASLDEAQKWAKSVGYDESDVDDIVKSVRKKKRGYFWCIFRWSQFVFFDKNFRGEAVTCMRFCLSSDFVGLSISRQPLL